MTTHTVLACAQSRADHVGRLGETLGPDSESLDDAVILRLDDGRFCVALATDPPYVREGMLCLACGSYDHTRGDACPTKSTPEAPTDANLAAALSEPTGEPTLAPAGATWLVGVAYDVDLRRRHAGCSVCGGAGWIGEESRPMKLCRREPPF